MSILPEKDQYPTDADRIVAALLALAVCIRPHPAGFGAEDASVDAVLAIYDSVLKSYAV